MELVQVIPGQQTRRKAKWVFSTYNAKTANKFSKSKEKQFLPPTIVDLPCGMSPEEVDQFFREQRIDELARKLRTNTLELGDLDIRDRSPAPSYDQHGVRTNPREVRVRRQMEDEFGRLNRYMQRRIPGYMPPGDLYRSGKILKKIQIPVDKFPDINFISIIVGPRGINHKRFQDESQCRIEFRGKDSSSTSQSFEESDMPLHVHIEGDTDESVERAVDLISPLLDPGSSEFQEARSGAAETIALLSGQEVRCSACQAVGHTRYSCPDAGLAPTSAEIKCAVCGGKGHLTMDCPQGFSGSSAILEVFSIPGKPVSSPIPSPGDQSSVEPVMLPSNVIGAFIGVQGGNIKKLMMESGCNIQVDQSKSGQPGITACPLVFTGPPAALAAARKICTDWIENHLKERESNNRITQHQRAMVGLAGFTDPEQAAQAVQMAYYQQMMWQAYYAQYYGNQGGNS